MPAVRQIIAMGGGGFIMDRTALLDDYVLTLARKKRPKVCFVGTATGDSALYIARFHEAFGGERAEASHLPLFGVPRTDIRDFLCAQDVIYVGGGNTANLLAVWRVHGVDRALKRAWTGGTILCGVSAGMICWFEAGVTDSFGPLRGLKDGLGLLRGSACPHYDGEADRRPTYHRLVRKGFPPGLAADDGAALHFRGRRLHACVASRKGAQGYHVTLQGGAVLETPLPTRLLGK